MERLNYKEKSLNQLFLEAGIETLQGKNVFSCSLKYQDKIINRPNNASWNSIIETIKKEFNIDLTKFND